MRTLAKLSAALLATCFAAGANATIYFAHGRMLSLDWAEDRWILKLEIHGYESGPVRLEHREYATVEIGYRPRCVPDKDIRTGKQPEEFEQSIGVFRRQIESGETVRFGWDASEIPGKRGEFVAVNLRAYGVGRPDELVWIIGPAMQEHCKFKYRGTRS
jgi:hypothetical protein